MPKTNFQASSINDFHKPVPDDHGTGPFGPSLARQEFADECDINQIMKRFESGQDVGFTPRVPMYLDLTEMPDNLQDTLNMLNEAEASFNSLPALVRKEFGNDPVEFVAYASDPKNLDQLREWGLAPPKPSEPAPQRVEIVNPPVPPGDGGTPPKAP